MNKKVYGWRNRAKHKGNLRYINALFMKRYGKTLQKIRNEAYFNLIAYGETQIKFPPRIDQGEDNHGTEQEKS